MLNGLLCTLPPDPAQNMAETERRTRVEKHQEDPPGNDAARTSASLVALILSRLHLRKPLE